MKITLDWQQYYREFCRLHGGSPVVYRQDSQTGKGGCLLFRDGWTYSRTDTQGPEQAPREEADQRKKARDYWTIREAVLVQELRDLRERVTELARLQDQRSAPLIAQQLVTIEDDEGRVTRKVQPVGAGLQPAAGPPAGADRGRGPLPPAVGRLEYRSPPGSAALDGRPGSKPPWKG